MVRENMAHMAQRMAQAADNFADFLEQRAQRGDDSERRLRHAAAERERARIHRRNAKRLRKAGGDVLHPVRAAAAAAGGLGPLRAKAARTVTRGRRSPTLGERLFRVTLPLGTGSVG